MYYVLSLNINSTAIKLFVNMFVISIMSSYESVCYHLLTYFYFIDLCYCSQRVIAIIGPPNTFVCFRNGCLIYVYQNKYRRCLVLDLY